ncbi:hypothetical protein DIPPA_07086 [Diplonema papillatum]|nr:hypothetical protein DIPPA_07086 [Diplonema papillatum]
MYRPTTALFAKRRMERRTINRVIYPWNRKVDTWGKIGERVSERAELQRKLDDVRAMESEVLGFGFATSSPTDAPWDGSAPRQRKRWSGRQLPPGMGG